MSFQTTPPSDYTPYPSNTLASTPTPTAASGETPFVTSGATAFATSAATPTATSGVTPMATVGAFATPTATSGATAGATPFVTSGATPFVTAMATPMATVGAATGATPFATAGVGVTPMATAGPTSTPFATTAPTASGITAKSLSDADPNSYIRMAIYAIRQKQYGSTISYTNLAINLQTQKGNHAAVAMLQVSNMYIRGAINPLENYYNQESNSLPNTATSWLIGTILYLLMMHNGTDVWGNAHPNVQHMLKALNASPPNVNSAIENVNAAINTYTANGQVAYIADLQQTLSGLIHYSSLTKQTLSPLQQCLSTIIPLLYRMDGKSTNEDYALWWGQGNGTGTGTGSSNTSIMGNATGTLKSATNANDSTNTVQQFLNSRIHLNRSMDHLTGYLNNKGGYDALIENIQDVQNDMNNL